MSLTESDAMKTWKATDKTAVDLLKTDKSKIAYYEALIKGQKASIKLITDTAEPTEAQKTALVLLKDQLAYCKAELAKLQPAASSSAWIWILIVVILVVAIGVGAFIFIKKRKAAA